MTLILDVALWIMMAGFFVLWGVFAVRCIELFRLKRRLSREPSESPEGAELVARATSRVVVVFVAAFFLMAVMVLLMLGQRGVSPEARDAKRQELVERHLAWRDKMMEVDGHIGLPLDRPQPVGFSYLAPNERQARQLREGLSTTLPYATDVSWFKEPTMGWFVLGYAPDVSLRTDDLRSWLGEMVSLGLDYGCEFHEWRIAKDHRLAD